MRVLQKTALSFSDQESTDEVIGPENAPRSGWTSVFQLRIIVCFPRRPLNAGECEQDCRLQRYLAEHLW